MLAELYKIKRRIMSGVSVIGYELETSDGKIVRLKKDIVNNLAMNNQIYGCKAQRYKGEIMIKGIDVNLKQLPKIDISKKQSNNNKITKIYTITKRVINKNEIYGYVIKNDTGQEKIYNKNDAIKLIKNGLVKNARVQKNNGSYIIRGVNCNLGQLEAISVNDVKKLRY